MVGNRLVIDYPFGVGIPAVIAVVFGIMTLIAIVDVVLEMRNQPPVAYYVQSWSTRSPWLAALLLGVLTAMLGHFFLHPTVFSTMPNT